MGGKRALEIATTLALDPQMLLSTSPGGDGRRGHRAHTALIRRVAKDAPSLMV